MSSLEKPVRSEAPSKPVQVRCEDLDNGVQWSVFAGPSFRADAMLVPLAEWRRLKRVEQLARDAVEAGAIDECYLSLLREALKTPKKKGARRGR